ncbi:DUF1573 domain-containing protein [candidate division CSSED10-310 bacterium]|uniref:DUF1573 domain-containing protein n=1 Tax=candidate division CSSED10-310 bacterium TaxID=2855610 RepID=A0ABV6Z4Y3_UNCC1
MFNQQDLIYDFGTLPQMGRGTKVIKFKNVGQGVLKIQDIRKTCGCTATILSSKELQPGQEGELRVTLNVKRRQGLIKKPIRISTNDPLSKHITLFVQAYVDVEFDVDRPLISFHNVQKNEIPKPQYTTLIGKNIKQIQIEKIETTNPLIQAQFIPPNDRFKDPRIEVSFKHGLPQGVIRGEVKVYSNNPKQPSTSFTVIAHVTGNIYVSRKSVYFHLSPSRLKQEQEVILRHHKMKNFKILKTEIDRKLPQTCGEAVNYSPPSEKDLLIDVKAPDQEGNISVFLTFTRSLKPGERVQGQLILTTNDREESTVFIKYTAYFTSSSSKQAPRTKLRP